MDGGLGYATAVMTAAGVAGGHLILDSHGFGAVVFVQGIWLVATGVKLWSIPMDQNVS